MGSARETVEAWYAAFGGKDAEKMRRLLAPDFTFRGPLMAFDDREAFVQAMAALPFDCSVDDSRLIADGGRVANVFTFRMTAPARAEIPMCEVFEVADGRIRSSRLFYDSKLFPAAGPAA